MSDDILHTGRADIHHPKGPLTAPAATSDVERWVYDYLRRVGGHETPRWDVAAREVVARVRAAALHDFAASMRTLAEQAPEGEPAGWPWTAYALAAVKAEEHAGKGFPRVQDGSTDTTGTPDPQRYWWQHDDCDSGNEVKSRQRKTLDAAFNAGKHLVRKG